MDYSHSCIVVVVITTLTGSSKSGAQDGHQISPCHSHAALNSMRQTAT